MITRLSIAFEDFLGSSIAPQVMPPCYRVLQIIIEYQRILQSITEYYRVLQSITKNYKVLQRQRQIKRIYLIQLLGLFLFKSQFQVFQDFVSVRCGESKLKVLTFMFSLDERLTTYPHLLFLDGSGIHVKYFPTNLTFDVRI